MTTQTQQPLLRIDRLSLAVERRGEERRILDEVSLSCDAGEFIGLVGESGSGKSMTLRTVVGLTPRGARLSGSVRLNEIDLVAATRSQVAEVRRRRAAMIFQDPRAHINPYQTIGAFMCEGLRVNRGLGRRDAWKTAARLLDEVGLFSPEAQLRKHPHELSGGMLQRVMIASALASEPELLLADEPTTALDVTTQAEIIAILQELRRSRGLAIVLVTHDLDLAAGSCDRIAVMRYGEIVEEAEARTLWNAPRHRYTQALLAAMPARLSKQDPVAEEALA
ncbi:ABC transporter ATP-binding protein [Leucobacter triazinivorans]|uniref:ABC transporter ATP-binding protein n=1 Tax=Leucobacter triazinivorans TaxID=1784719 RepID=A0A4P6KHN0_9MICO|nr:ABC transporter ATP-binding protein [Leucobacter triazinivorans]QBE50067.1 ABC transporter ATP-binding protein [Leucobacter triazinivorans]